MWFSYVEVFVEGDDPAEVEVKFSTIFSKPMWSNLIPFEIRIIDLLTRDRIYLTS